MRTRTAPPLLVVLLSLVTACSGTSDKPTVLPSLSPTPVATTSPAAIPVAARAKTPQGADAFARFFFTQMNVAFTHGGPELIASLSNDRCVLCHTYEDSVADARSKGHFLGGDTWIVRDVAAAQLQKLGTRVEVFGSIPARDLVDGSGKVLQTIPSDGDFHFELTLFSVRGGWEVAEMHDVA